MSSGHALRLNGLSSVTHVGLSQLVDGCPHLSSLSLSCIENINDTATTDLAKMQFLTELDVSYCEQLTDRSMAGSPLAAQP